MTTQTDLEAQARKLLDKAHGEPRRALPPFRALLKRRADFFDAVALFFLENLSPGQRSSDAPRAVAGGAAAGQASDDTHGSRASGGANSKPFRVREHRRARKRTDEERAIARSVAMQTMPDAFKRVILGKAIGSYRWRELPQLRRDLMSRTAGKVYLGDHGVAAVLIDKLLCYGEVPLDTLVADALPPERFAELEVEAAQDAPDRLNAVKEAAQVAFAEQSEWRPPTRPEKPRRAAKRMSDGDRATA